MENLLHEVDDFISFYLSDKYTNKLHHLLDYA